MGSYEEFAENVYFIFDALYKLAPFIAILVVFVMLLDKSKKGKDEKELVKIGNRKQASGVIFGLNNQNTVVYSPYNEEGHISVFGGSGLGKTSALLIPTLRSWKGTSFTVDISGDICKNVKMPNKLVYEPSNPKTIPYDIFYPIDQMEGVDDQNEALERLAFLLMPEDANMSDTSKFFNTEGRKILTASLIAFYHSGMDFIPICERIVSSSWQDLFNDIDETQNDKAIQYINSFAGTSEQNTAGCKQSCDSVLKLFATNERVKKSVHRPKTENELCFTPEVLEQHNVFVIIEDAKLELYAPLLHIITAQNLDYFSERPAENKTTILFCLDEFASFGRLELTGALRKLRKKHVRIMILTQSVPDIDLIYGKSERASMMNNFRFKVLLSADDPDTQEYFAKLIGYENAKKNSVSKSAKAYTYTESEAREWIIEPAKLARLDAEDSSLILLCGGMYMRIKKNYYFK